MDSCPYVAPQVGRFSPLFPAFLRINPDLKRTDRIGRRVSPSVYYVSCGIDVLGSHFQTGTLRSRNKSESSCESSRYSIHDYRSAGLVYLEQIRVYADVTEDEVIILGENQYEETLTRSG